MDARCGLVLRVSCGLEPLSDGTLSGWRSYLYPLISPAPVGSRLTAHAWPAGDSDVPELGVLVPPLHARPGAAARLRPRLHSTGAFRIAARGPRPVRSRPATRTSLACCLQPVGLRLAPPRGSRPARSRPATRTSEVSCLRPVFRSVTHLAAISAVHSVTARG